MPARFFHAAPAIVLISLSSISSWPAGDCRASDIFTYGAAGWRYQVLIRGDPAAQAFMNPSYDDAGWPAGAAGFGTPGGRCPLDSTVSSPWYTGTELLLRRRFTPDLVRPTVLHLACNHAMVWVNGKLVTEVGQDACPRLDLFETPLPDSILHSGENLLAVMALDRGLPSFFDARLEADSVDAHWWTGFAREDRAMPRPVHAMIPFGGELVAAGEVGFMKIAGVSRCVGGIVRWDGSAWSALGHGLFDKEPRSDYSCGTTITTLATYRGELVASGSFHWAWGIGISQHAEHIARWNGTNWYALELGLNAPAEALIEHDGQLIAAGGFTQASGVPILWLATWRGGSWHPLVTNLSYASQFLEHQGELLALGRLVTDSNASVYVLHWDGASWTHLGSNRVRNGTGLGTFRGELVAAVEQTVTIGNGSYPVPLVSRWDGTSWQPLGDPLIGDVSCLTEYNGRLYVAGRFAGVESRLVRLEGSSWVPLGHGIGNPNDGWIEAMLVYQGSLYVGGGFRTAGTRLCPNLARWDDTIVTPVFVEDLEAVSSPDAVLLRWRLATSLLGDLDGIRVQRGGAAAGPFAVVTPAALVPETRMFFEDRDVCAGAVYWYRLVLESKRGAASIVGPIRAAVGPAGVSRPYLLPQALGADGAVEIRYGIGRPGSNVRLDVFDVSGRLVRSFLPGTLQAGEYLLTWDRTDEHRRRAVRGVYIVRLQSGSEAASRKYVVAGK